jgi:hypothetical protein
MTRQIAPYEDRESMNSLQIKTTFEEHKKPAQIPAFGLFVDRQLCDGKNSGKSPCLKSGGKARIPKKLLKNTGLLDVAQFLEMSYNLVGESKFDLSMVVPLTGTSPLAYHKLHTIRIDTIATPPEASQAHPETRLSWKGAVKKCYACSRFHLKILSHSGLAERLMYSSSQRNRAAVHRQCSE